MFVRAAEELKAAGHACRGRGQLWGRRFVDGLTVAECLCRARRELSTGCVCGRLAPISSYTVREMGSY